MAVEDFWIATTVESVLDPSCIGVDEVAHRTTDSARPGWLARGRAAACSRGCWIGNRAVVRRLCGHRVRLGDLFARLSTLDLAIMYGRPGETLIERTCVR